jgi:putative addiction module component (TIGR02574 family)
MKDTEEYLNPDKVDIDVAWASEIEKRIEEVETGEAKTSTWEESRKRIRARLANR